MSIVWLIIMLVSVTALLAFDPAAALAAMIKGASDAVLLSLDLITAGGCAKASNLASCAASAVVWILHGQVLWALAIPALACSIAGNYLGALYAIRGGSKKIRSVMFLVLGLLFVKMLYELLF